MGGIMSSTITGNASGGGSGGTTYSVTVGYSSVPAYNIYNYGYNTSIGSISPSTFTNTGSAIVDLYVLVASGTTELIFAISGSHPQNSFSTLVVGGVSYTSASASYSAGTLSQWYWTITTNPFATIGSVVPVTIT